MHSDRVIIFVCEHGAAKSILAAAYFNRLAHAQSLNMNAIARGTNPDPQLSEKTVQGLSRDGIEPTESTPHKLSMEDVRSAQRIVSFCEIPAEFEAKTLTEYWHNIPAVSEDYDKARDVIVEHLNKLISELRSSS